MENILLVDTHCHLNFEAFDGDRDQVIQRAQEAGVRAILNPGVDLDSSRAAVALTDRYAGVYAAVGVHPNSATSWDATTLGELRELAQHPRVVAIGEIGLDDYRERAPRDLQERILREQLELAADLALPVVLHTRNHSPQDRRAVADTMEILRQWRDRLLSAGSPLAQSPGVLHSFSDGVAAAQQATGMEFMIGITGPVAFRNAAELQEVVSAVSPDSLLVETDAPFLTPHPHRGERNEPGYVRYVVEKVAQIKGIPTATAAGSSVRNAERLFHWQVMD